MRVLVIGGSGNISYAVVQELLSCHHDVAVLNRGNQKIPGVRQLTADRYTEDSFLPAVSGEAFDCVIDMICYCSKDAELLIRAFAGRVQQIVFCSTVDVYRKPALSYPVSESAEIGADPAFEYAWQKVQCEQLLREEAAKGAFALTVVRPAATYNDQSTPISLVGDGRGLLYRIKMGKPLMVMGDGSSLWSSTHRDDVGRAIAHAVGNPRAMNNSYTLASDEALTWERYYQIVAAAMGAPEPEIIGVHWRELVRAGRGSCDWCGWNFRFNNIFDCSRAKKDLGFKAAISWRQGAERFVRWHEERGNIDARYEDPDYDRILAEVRGVQI